MRTVCWWSAGVASAVASNKIRKDFPGVFEKMAKTERKMNVSICSERSGERVFLDELDPERGNYKTEPEAQCGIFCGGIL